MGPTLLTLVFRGSPTKAAERVPGQTGLRVALQGFTLLARTLAAVLLSSVRNLAGSRRRAI